MLGAEGNTDCGGADHGRQRLNIHGAIDLETGRTRMLEVDTVDAVSPTFATRLLKSPKRANFRGSPSEGRHHRRCVSRGPCNIGRGNPGRRLSRQFHLQPPEQEQLVRLGFRIT